MIFIVRTQGAAPAGAAVKLQRRTPGGATGMTDYFCTGDPSTITDHAGEIVLLHDGWYADDTGGGVAIFGQGRFWEVRDTPFTVRESDDSSGVAASVDVAAETINVRNAIFGV